MKEVFVLGLGYVGLPLAIEASKNGFSVTGFDINSRKIQNLKRGICGDNKISSDTLLKLQKDSSLVFVSELPKTQTSSIFIIAVPTPLDEKRNPDLRYLRQACLKISETIADGSLVITESTSYVGTLRDFIMPLVEKFSTANDLHFAVAPERIDPGNVKWDISNTPRVVGGITKHASNLAADFYSVFCNQVIQVSSPEVAETSKLLENTFRQVNIALVNEVATLAKTFNISMHEVVDAASSKPFGFMEFRPGIGVGGHCIPVDPVYLSYTGDRNNIQMELVKLSNSKNYSQVKYVLNHLISLFKGSISGRKIQIVGIAYKRNISDVRESPAIELIYELRKLGAIVVWHDPIVKEFKDEKSQSLQSEIDLGVILTPHDGINFEAWSGIKDKLVDLSSGKQILGLSKFF